MGLLSIAVSWLIMVCATLALVVGEVPTNEISGAGLRSAFNQGMSRLLSRFYDDSAAAGSYCTPWRKCAESLSCTFWDGKGDYGIGVCKRIVALGYRCSGPNDHCEKPAKCNQGYGENRCRTELSLGGICGDQKKTLCRYDLLCRKGYCVRDLGYGESCEGKFNFCRTGFRCDGHLGNRVCKVVVKKGGSCSYDNSVCYPGLACSKWGTQSRCVRPYGKGGHCDKPFALCRRGLTCHGTRGRKRCSNIVGLRASCEGGHSLCKAGLTCVSYPGRKKCEFLSSKGGVCGIPYHYSQSDLFCLSFDKGRGKCVGVAKVNGQCDGKFGLNMVCGPGMTCVGHEGKKTCMKIVQQGQKMWKILRALRDGTLLPNEKQELSRNLLQGCGFGIQM